MVTTTAPFDKEFDILPKIIPNESKFIPNKSKKIASSVFLLTSSFFHFTLSKISDIASSIFGKSPTILKSETAWRRNFSLMSEAQKKTDNLTLKNEFRFLSVNYLNKIAPLMPATARIMSWKFFESAFQVSPFSRYQYHRAFSRYCPNISDKTNERFALKSSSPLVLTDTPKFEQFLPLKFVVLNRDNEKNWKQLILDAMERNEDLLFDFTKDLGGVILTEGVKELEDDFSILFEEIKEEINGLIDSMEEKQNAQVRKFLKQKCAAICRVKFECYKKEIGGMKILPLFTNLTSNTVLKIHKPLVQSFMEETGIVLGAIQLRRLIPEAFPLPKSSKESEKDFSKISYYENKQDFLDQKQTEEFQLLVKNSTKSHVQILGLSFIQMLQSLFDKIDKNSGDIYEDEDQVIKQIFQAALSNIITHLETANNSIEDDNDNGFIQAMELAFAELITLLELTLPYKSRDFGSIYTGQLKIVPEKLRRYVKGGLGKTAETVFAGVNLAIRADEKKPVTTWCNWFYFEHANFIGKNQKLETILADESVEQIDLYGCAFNPSIESDHTNTNYAQRDLIGDIERILKEKPKTDRLTIALDFTNDYFNSEKTKALLTHFEDEILEGKLNFVLFGSGQKFDMLGMDHCYGSPFYIINNNDEDWESFDELFRAEVNQTDRLSNQWFCLLYEFAADQVDEFRRLFFENNRDVLKNIPESLRPAKGRNITVSSVDDKSELTFIDVKIKGTFHKFKASLLVAYFQCHAVAEKVKASIRGSFGFLHPNVTLIFGEGSTTLRLHSGILRSDNRAIINFLQSIG